MPTLYQLKNRHSNVHCCDCCGHYYRRKNQKANHYCGTCRQKIYTNRQMVLASMTWKLLLVMAGNVCPSCGQHCPVFTIDHIIPLSKRWDWSWQNLQPLCQLCNVRKGKGRTDYRPRWWLDTLRDLEETTI